MNRPLRPLAQRVFAVFPTTILLTLAFLVIGLLTSTVLPDQYPSIRRYVGWDVDTLQAARYWRQLPSTLIQGQPGVKWQEPLFMLAFVGLLEFQAGSKLALVIFFLCDWLSAPVATLLLWYLGTHGSESAAALLHTPSSGASAAYLGAGAVALMLLPARWNVVATLLLVIGVAWSFTFQPLDASLAHFFAVTIGLGAGIFLRQRLPERRVVSFEALWGWMGRPLHRGGTHPDARGL